MGTNPYFNKFHRTSEQNLVDDLVRESIQIHGHDFVYLPRTLIKEDLIYGEDVLSKFEDYYDIEMYIKTYDAFEGQGDVFTTLGVDIKDQVKLWVSRTRWDAVVASELQRPREGDLLYYPLHDRLGEGKGLFQITFVKEDTIHFQLGDMYVYEITAEKYAWSHEEFKTGIDEVDGVEKALSYTLELTLGAGAGNYLDDEMVYQGASLAASTASAQVTLHDPTANTIKVRNIKGDFDLGAGNLIGDTSAASYAIVAVDYKDDIKDATNDNVELETEADAIIDFTEKDPFSEDNY